MLVLLDGRSIYQDFFGFVMWDFLPVNLNEIKQVEVIRGPASAVWGASGLWLSRCELLHRSVAPRVSVPTVASWREIPSFSPVRLA